MRMSCEQRTARYERRDERWGEIPEGGEKFKRKREGGLIGLLCSRNARSRTPLVGRAQWETNSGHPPGEDVSELGRRIK